MKHNTLSLCPICYRHIAATKFKQDRTLWMSKTCPEHGYSKSMMEREWLFVESLVNDPKYYESNGYVIDITDRCNLKCPHCYQIPDNRKTDKPIDEILTKIKNYPDDGIWITLAGAEPTMRKDIFQLINSIKNLHLETGHKPRKINILTNGVLLDNENFLIKLKEAGIDSMTIGLNHPDYQGQDIHERQIKGIQNCVRLEVAIKNINYTIESLSQIPFILREIQTFKDVAKEFRIRGGAKIGRSPDDEEKLFLSDIVYEVYRQCENLKYKWDKIPGDDNIYKYNVKINGVKHRLIQWADVTNIDLDELHCGPWGDLIPGVPLTNLMHQVILRDAVVNKGMTLLDEIPHDLRR